MPLLRLAGWQACAEPSIHPRTARPAALLPPAQMERMRGLEGKSRWLLEARFYDSRLLQVTMSPGDGS